MTRIIRPLSKQKITSPVNITSGNFDGVHRGHQALLARLVQQAKTNKQLAGVIIFEPHANEYFALKNQTPLPERLLSLQDKITLLKQQSLDFIAIYNFNDHSIQTTAEQFIETCLLSRFNIAHITIGDDFRFGADRKGDVNLLRHYGNKFGFTLEQMPTCREHRKRISSTAVRALMHQGQIEQAKQLLGYNYFISGRIIQGKQLGRTLGTPTANLSYKQHNLALSGVYITWLTYKNRIYPSVTHIGYNRTLEQQTDKLRVETHVLDQNIHLYGAKVTITFLKKLRAEQKFADIDALKQAMELDKKQARLYFQDSTARNLLSTQASLSQMCSYPK